MDSSHENPHNLNRDIVEDVLSKAAMEIAVDFAERVLLLLGFADENVDFLEENKKEEKRKQHTFGVVLKMVQEIATKEEASVFRNGFKFRITNKGKKRNRQRLSLLNRSRS